MKLLSKNKYIIFIFFAIIVFGTVLFLLTNKKDIARNFQPTFVNQNNPTENSDSSSFIESLRQREYRGGEIKIEETLSSNNSYTKYLISYPSDDLKIYGVMNVPSGNGPFPTVILNHGYFNASTFSSGDGTDGMANILASNGYLTLASDYRGFGKSENDGEGSRGHNPNYAIDVLNLIASVPTLQKADINRIGMWGHSMGGEVTLRTSEVTDKLKAIVLWAPTSANASDNAAFYGRGRHTGIPSLGQTQDTDGTSPINHKINQLNFKEQTTKISRARSLKKCLQIKIFSSSTFIFRMKEKLKKPMHLSPTTRSEKIWINYLLIKMQK